MRDLPSITALQAFEAAARRLSFKQAADELRLTAGAVSRQIQGLEAALGAPLFRRLHRRVELTPAGAVYLADVAPSLAALRAAGERMAARAQTPSVAIVAYPTFAVRWFMPRWGRFLDAHPNIDLRLSTSLNPVDFTRGDADIAIHVADGRAFAGNIAYWKLMDMDLFPVAAPAVAARLDRPADLARTTLIHSAPRPDDWPRWLALTAAEARGVEPASGLRFESLNLALQAAIEGLGVAIGFAAVASDDIAAARLVQPFRAVRRSARAMYVTQPAAGVDAPEMRAVREWLLREAADTRAARPLPSVPPEAGHQQDQDRE